MSNILRCPKCEAKSQVIDSRPERDYVRRRRRCTACKFRWTTFELPVLVPNNEENVELLTKLVIQAKHTISALEDALGVFEQVTKKR